MLNTRGRFIVLEGADGCGKTTQAFRLATSLRVNGLEVAHLREPGSTSLGEAVRGILLDPRHGEVSVRAEVLLYMAARAQMVEEVLRPALDRGVWVVCERWVLSSEVYQGMAGGMGIDSVRALGDVATGGLVPDLVLVLDVGVGEGLRRLCGEPDRMEAKGDEFHRRVVEAYRTPARERPGHVLVPAGGIEETARSILALARSS